MTESSSAQWLGVSRREVIHITAMLCTGAVVGAVLLSLLLPTWDDARTALALAGGRTGRDINEAVRDSPLPSLSPGAARLVGRPLPPPPTLQLPESDESIFDGGPMPAPEGGRYQREFEMQRRQYEFY